MTSKKYVKGRGLAKLLNKEQVVPDIRDKAVALIRAIDNLEQAQNSIPKRFIWFVLWFVWNVVSYVFLGVFGWIVFMSVFDPNFWLKAYFIATSMWFNYYYSV